MANESMMQGRFATVDPFVPGAIPHATSPYRIPKVFHKVWFDMGNGVDVPLKYKKHHLSLIKHHPDWVVVLWTREKAERLIRELFPWFMPCWNGFVKPIFQIDAIRYLILYAFGGVYIDQDVTVKRSMNPMILGPNEYQPRRNILILSHRGHITVSNFVMAAERESKFFAHTIRRLSFMSDSIWNMENSFFGTLFTAGPYFITRALWSYDDSITEVIVLPVCSFTNEEGIALADLYDVPKGDFDNHYGIHHFHSTWSSKKMMMFDYARILVIVIIIVLVCIAGYLIFKQIKTSHHSKQKKRKMKFKR